ncbi:CobW/HypB/UreG, nucleotide-binding domain [Dillenia turbinata]|uniref:CobW/HypB/UreG, nucleotide-binding domain n=1 Tax=Dillenia turbinata TaxID=194707 RepID=A0AAN8VAM0_9MAGN
MQNVSNITATILEDAFMENVLTSQHGMRIAVILNEFDEEIGVERSMINEEDGTRLVEEWVELANGCICCFVKHSLAHAFQQPAQRKERLDHILIETTRLANPAPLASILWLDDQLESTVRLDFIVTMDNALIDDQRIHVDFSQSVAKLWSQYKRKENQNGRGIVVSIHMMFHWLLAY